MTTIDISNRFTPEIMNSKAGKRLCNDNPNTNIYIHRDEYTVLSQANRSPIIPFEHALFHKGQLCCISIARSNDVDFRNIQKIQKRETGIRVFIFPREIYGHYSESESDSEMSDTFVFPPTKGAAPRECSHEIQWNVVSVYPLGKIIYNVIKDFTRTYQEQFKYILNHHMCYMMTLQYPKLNPDYMETKLFIDETYYLEPRQSIPIVMSSNHTLHDRIREFKEYSIQPPIIEYPVEYPVPHCVSLFQWLKYRFFKLPQESVTIFHGSHKSFASKSVSQKSMNCLCCINIKEYSNDDETKVSPISL